MTALAVHPAAAHARQSFHADIVAAVRSAVERDPVVVVGMGWNPHVGRARRMLRERNIPHTYLGYGNYLMGWRKRLAIKIWAGWPTFPMVFVGGQLVGGASDLRRLIDSGEIDRLIG